jgi:hypothetical protein
MSGKVSSKKAQEGINNRLQVVMRSGKYTVRTIFCEFYRERRIISLRVQDDDDDDDFGGPLDWIVFLRRRRRTTVSSLNLSDFFLSFFLYFSLSL